MWRNIWTSKNWKKCGIVNKSQYNNRIEITFEAGVDRDLRKSVLRFISWLQIEYTFPKKCTIYILNREKIPALDGDLVYGTFFGPFNSSDDSYIRIAVGDYIDMVEERGRDNAITAILITIIHEVTHYFQWVNGRKDHRFFNEIEAKIFQKVIIHQYEYIVEHP